KGARWLVWKEDGNSKKIPTILWLQRLTDDGLKLTGERRAIMRNDAPWEGAVVEGPFMLRRGDWYYLFYAGGACCGRNCNYAVGVARAKDPLGPWEKAPSNPIMAQNETWRCPGHGSLVTDADGRTWFLYHAYATKGFVATGREMLLDEVVFGADGWPTINGGKGPSALARGPAAARSQQQSVASFREDFNGSGALAPGWQWPIARQPVAKIGSGRLTLTATEEPATAVQSITVPSFVAETSVDAKSISPGAFAGLVVFGDRVNQLALVTDGKKIQVWNQRRGDRTTVAEADAVSAAMVRLRIACIDGNKFRFAVQGGTGAWQELAAETDGSFLPPWDRGVRTGLLVAGPKDAAGSFDYFTSTPDDGKLFQP
ncbi:MAG TPA: family 43 glycosylhydrolase, partial [Opitutaceae bacterium]|nr:family 43 glycosylhydrolase [Opitutaceae bacterium]